MKLHSFVLSLVLASPAVCFSQDAEFEDLVDELLEITGALNIGEQMGQLVLAQMFEALRAVDANVPDRAYEVIESEVSSIISDEMKSGSFQALFYPIYARHLSKSELQAMVAFYRTPEGKHIAEVLPALSQEGMLAGQAWGESLGPEIGRRIVDKLRAEGIEIP